jgi:hypothetical protein
MQDDPYLNAAAGCFGLARNYMRKPTLGDTFRLDVCDYYQAVCEIVCFLLHMSDRMIFETAPKSRDVRMDALVLATVQVLAEEIRADPNVPYAARVIPCRPTPPTESPLSPEYGANNQVVTRAQYDAARASLNEWMNRDAQRWVENPNDAMAVATEIFRDLYDARMAEYAAVGDDWSRKVLFKFGRNFSEALNEGELSYQIYMDAQMEGVRMHSALVGFTPELFKP